MGKPRKNQQSQQSRKSKIVQSVREELWEKLEKTEISSSESEEEESNDSEEEEDSEDEDESEDSKEEEKDCAPFPVAMWDMSHCDPKRCSGKKMARHGLIKELKLGQKWPGVCLSPKGTHHTMLCASSDQCLSQVSVWSPRLIVTLSPDPGPR